MSATPNGRVQVNRVPSKPVRRQDDGSIAIDLWLRRDGVFDAVRDLGHRWGSYRAGPGNGVISLHWAAFQLPIRLVDYVIAHELAHVRVSGHGADYWRLLSRALPECRQVKVELDELGRRVWMGDLSP